MEVSYIGNMAFGLTRRFAEIIDVDAKFTDLEEGELVMDIAAQGITRRAAVRAARLEAASLIPIEQQEITSVTKTKTLKRIPPRQRYMVTIEHNTSDFRR